MSDSDPCIQATEAAIVAGAVSALRKRATAQAAIASGGTAAAGDGFLNVTIRTGNATIAGRLAVGLARLADELEAEGKI
jgi:hypothetical protein